VSWGFRGEVDESQQTGYVVAGERIKGYKVIEGFGGG
jgi:hypothetical protein